MTEDPFSAHSSAPSINKIPFLVFDAILVITAIALAFSAGGPLSPMLFFWILLCVIAGGLIGCLPFWIEFRDKVRLSEYEIRERQNSVHDSQWQYVDARLAEQNEYLQKLHLRLSDSAERLAALEARPPTPTADEVATLCGNALQKQWPAWREELLTVLSRRTDVLFNEQNAQSAKLSAAHEKRLAELRREFTSVEAVLRGLETRVGEIALLSVATGTAVVAQGAQTATAQASARATRPAVTKADKGTLTDSTATADAVDSREAITAPEADTNTLSTATDATPATSEAQDTTDAQSPTTDTSDNTPTDSNDNTPADTKENTPTDAKNSTPTDARGNTLTDAGQNTPTDAVIAEEVFIEETAFAADATTIAAAEAESAIVDEVSDEVSEHSTPSATPGNTSPLAAEQHPTPEQPAAPAQSTPSEPATAPEQPALLETPEQQPARPQKNAATDKTTLVAQVLIGIGNKPYVRGVGPGLSMDKGVPMQFVEIGKWEWVCPSGSAPVRIQIYKNDEIPSTLGEIELEPGQRKAVTPAFPK